MLIQQFHELDVLLKRFVHRKSELDPIYDLLLLLLVVRYDVVGQLLYQFMHVLLGYFALGVLQFPRKSVLNNLLNLAYVDVASLLLVLLEESLHIALEHMSACPFFVKNIYMY